MLSFAIYIKNEQVLQDLKNSLQEYLISNKIIAKVYVFTEIEKFLKFKGSFDISFFYADSDDFKNKHLRLSILNNGSNNIFIITKEFLKNEEITLEIIQGNWCLYYPLNPIKFIKILDSIREKIKEETVIIKSCDGERKLSIKKLNYICIEKRCLCYHLRDGILFDSQVLRESFEKATSGLNGNPYLFFLKPSLLINLSNIEVLNKDHIVFQDKSTLYYPKKSYELLRSSWKEYNKIK